MDPVPALRISNSVYLSCSLVAVAAIFWIGIQGMRIVERDRSARRARPRLRPRVHPDRARLSRRPLLQLLRLPRAGPVQLPALQSAGNPGTDLFGTADSGIDYGVIGGSADPVGPVLRDRDRPRDRAGARPRPRPGDLGQHPRRRLVAALDAGDDDVLQRPRALSTLPGECLTPPRSSRSPTPATGCPT